MSREDLVSSILDEIALEGLEGITLEGNIKIIDHILHNCGCFTWTLLYTNLMK